MLIFGNSVKSKNFILKHRNKDRHRSSFCVKNFFFMFFIISTGKLPLLIKIAILHQTTRKTSNLGVGRGVKGYWLLVSSTSSAEAAGCKEVKPARPAELTKNPILKQSNCFCHTAVRSNKRESYLRQQYCGIIGLSYSN